MSKQYLTHEQYQVFLHLVDREEQQIERRTAWFLGLSGLLAVASATLAKVVDGGVAAAPGATASAEGALSHSILLTGQVVLISLGVILSLLTFVGVCAAYAAIKNARAQAAVSGRTAAALATDGGYSPTLLPCGDMSIRRRGDAPAMVLPMVFAFAWQTVAVVAAFDSYRSWAWVVVVGSVTVDLLAVRDGLVMLRWFDHEHPPSGGSGRPWRGWMTDPAKRTTPSQDHEPGSAGYESSVELLQHPTNAPGTPGSVPPQVR